MSAKADSPAYANQRILQYAMKAWTPRTRINSWVTLLMFYDTKPESATRSPVLIAPPNRLPIK